MKAKKIVALLLAAAMTLSLAACGGGNNVAETTDSAETTEAADETGDAAETTEGEAATEDDYEALLADFIPEETVTLDVYSQLANYAGEQIGWFGQVMLEKFNVKLNIINEADGVYQTRMESGNLGDLVIWGSDGDQYVQAVEKGMLFDWNEDDILADFGPYIAENFPKALEKNANLSGGKIYGFGFEVATDPTQRQDIMYSWDIRWDLYKELGYPEIKGYDDLVEVLADMKEICPTDDNGKPTYGMALFDDWDGDMVMYVKSMVSAMHGYDEFGFGFYDPEAQEYIPALEEDGPYFEALKFYNNLFQRGLLDPDSQTQKNEGATEDYQNGTAFFNIFNFLGSSNYNTEAHQAENKMMLPCPPTESRPIAYGLTVYGGNRIWSIGAKTEYPELCMAILNWLSTPDGCLTMLYGPQDVTWYYDEAGNTCFTDLGRSCVLDRETEMADGYTGTYGDGECKINNRTWVLDAVNPNSASGEPFNHTKWASWGVEPKCDIEADWQEYTGCTRPDERVGQQEYRLSPGSMYTAGVRPPELEVIWQQVSTCIKENSWKAIYAKDDAEFDQHVANMISQAKEYGYDQCVEFQTAEAEKRGAAETEAMAAVE